MWLRDLTIDWGVELSADNYINTVIPERYFGVNIDSFNGAAKHLRPAQYNVFTDGSKTASGAAIYKGTAAIDELKI